MGLKTFVEGIIFISPFLPSDQRESSFPADPECGAISTTAVQQRTLLFLFLIVGQPAAARHLWGSPAEQAETFPDHAAAVWQRHLSRDWRQRPKPRSGPRGRSIFIKVTECLLFFHFRLWRFTETFNTDACSSELSSPCHTRIQLSPLRSSIRGFRRPPTSPYGPSLFPFSR